MYDQQINSVPRAMPIVTYVSHLSPGQLCTRGELPVPTPKSTRRSTEKRKAVDAGQSLHRPLPSHVAPLMVSAHKQSYLPSTHTHKKKCCHTTEGTGVHETGKSGRVKSNDQQSERVHDDNKGTGRKLRREQSAASRLGKSKGEDQYKKDCRRAEK